MARTLSPAPVTAPDLESIKRWADVEASPLTLSDLRRSVQRAARASVRGPIVWAIPSRGFSSLKWLQGFWLNYRHPDDCVWISFSSLIHANRNKLTETFLAHSEADPRFEWMLQWDDDVVFLEAGQDNVARMIRVAQEHNAKIVSGLYIQKNGELVPHVYEYHSMDGGVGGRPEFKPILNYAKGSVVEADAVGGGCLLIHRDVLWDLAERIQPGWRPNQKDETGDPIDPPEWFNFYMRLGEDMAFCHQARQAGYKILVDTSIKLGHITEEALTFDHHIARQIRLKGDTGVAAAREGIVKRMGERANGKASADVLDQMFDEGCDTLKDFLGIDEETLTRRLENSVMDAAAAWNAADLQTADDERQFYRTTDSYYYDLLQWNRLEEYAKRIRPAMQMSSIRVADLGGGIGTLCLLLARQGREVHYVEVNDGLADFATERFGKYNALNTGHEYERGKIATHTSLFALRDLDLITAIDTLEHIHPDDIDGMAEQIARALRPGGRFYAHSSFEEPDAEHPQHRDTGAEWEVALKKVGLRKHDLTTWLKEE